MFFQRALCAAMWTAVAFGQNSPPDPVFGLIGGSLGQILRLNVSAIGDPGIRCAATTGFRAMDGRTAPGAVDRSVDLGAGQSAFVELNLNTLVSRLGQRVELRPVVHVTGGSCLASAEVYEPVTGRIAAIAIGDPDIIGDPEVNINFPPVAGAIGQTMRLGVVRGIQDPGIEPAPCSVELGFRDAAGNAVGGGKRVTLAGGTGDFLDLNINSILPAGARRVTLQPTVRRLERGSALGCQASLQVFDNFTAWTSVFITDPGI